ncbi:hypothetical protein SBRCBS47491_005464 [Sporothrix bragantina]|uniref:Uncharacterized protein n=1 Tax=Sporothrix bragantina TaxID=671064 RepID=A0ABP0BXR0_9PEZI
MKRSRTTADGASTDAGHRPAPAPPQETTSESLVQSLQEFRAKFTVTREVLATSRKKAAESRKEEALLRKAGEAASTTPAKPASAVVWPAPLATLPRAFTKAGRKPKPAPIFPKLPKFSGDDAEDFWEWRGALCDKYEEDEDEFESPEDWYKYVFSYLETQVQDRVLKRMGSEEEEEEEED